MMEYPYESSSVSMDKTKALDVAAMSSLSIIVLLCIEHRCMSINFLPWCVYPVNDGTKDFGVDFASCQRLKIASSRKLADVRYGDESAINWMYPNVCFCRQSEYLASDIEKKSSAI